MSNYLQNINDIPAARGMWDTRISPEHLQGLGFSQCRLILAHGYKSSATPTAAGVSADNMAAWFLSAVLLAAAMSHTAGRTLPPTTSRSPAGSERAAYISQATALYNSESDGEVVYKLLGAPPEEESQDDENIIFIIKETVCLKSAEKDEKCPFKEDGVVKNCTASLPGSEGRHLEVNCQNIDTSDDSSQKEENKKSEPVKSHRVFKLLRSNKKKPGSNFLQFDNKSALDNHSAASCLACIFDFLNPNTNAGR